MINGQYNEQSQLFSWAFYSARIIRDVDNKGEKAVSFWLGFPFSKNDPTAAAKQKN